MGYKLAGYDVIGANDIDRKMQKVYIANHHPKHYLLGDIRELLTCDLPEELMGIDVLDGSPPCSTFSLSGLREKAWGKEKTFREGQSKQVLDDLFFHFLAFADRIKPKFIIAENVKGMLAGNAKGYLLEIMHTLRDMQYTAQLFSLNAARMGVPQRRERVFIIAHRNEYTLPKLNLQFDDKPITFGEVRSPKGSYEFEHTGRAKLMKQCIRSDNSINDINQRLYKKLSGFNEAIRHDSEICGTIVSNGRDWRFCDKLSCTTEDYIACGTFPVDYNFMDIKPKYLIGMSVPPVMMAQVAYELYIQWIQRTKGGI